MPVVKPRACWQPVEPRGSDGPIWLLMAITLAAAAIRFGNIALVEQDFSLDESHTIYVNTVFRSNWWSFIINDSSHPPLFPAILEGMDVACWGWSHRFAGPVCCFGVLTVPAIFSLGSELLLPADGGDCGLAGRDIAGLIFYSGVVRAYSLLVWIGVVSTVWFVRVLKSGSRGWRIYAICLILGLYTHYLFIMVCIGQAFAFGLSPARTP